ncbi:MAG: hypothetical protein U1C57_01360 [Candidatus Doudnabacteria bacterium]|nr:hypothetical protein [bacterium]MDZ4243730.1 hypothetical protein [Candidatus Doudnabacteria bacterium]
MSNGTVVESGKVVLFDQLSKVMELVREGNRTPAEVSRVLQAFISDDVISIAPKVVSTPTGKVFYVTGNFASAAEAIAAGNYDLKWGVAESPAEIPLIVQPVDARVRAIRLGRIVRTGELFELYPRLADPMTFLTFGVKFPEEQREAPHFTVWKDTSGQFWCAILYVRGARRGVCVARCGPGDVWFAGCRVLVRESA